MGIEFLIRGEKLGIAADTIIRAGSLFFEFLVYFTVGHLRAGLAGNPVLFGGELFAPLGVCFCYGFLWLLRGLVCGCHGLLCLGLDHESDTGKRCQCYQK